MNIFGTAGLCSAKLVLWLTQYLTCTYMYMFLMCLMCIMIDCHFLYKFNFIDFQIETLIQFEFCTCQIHMN